MLEIGGLLAFLRRWWFVGSGGGRSGRGWLMAADFVGVAGGFTVAMAGSSMLGDRRKEAGNGFASGEFSGGLAERGNKKI